MVVQDIQRQVKGKGFATGAYGANTSTLTHSTRFHFKKRDAEAHALVPWVA